MVRTFHLLDLTQEEYRNRLGWFFRQEANRMLWTPMLFDSDRWGQCDEAIVAEENGEILGIITLASKGVRNSGQPTLETLYVQKRHRRRGLGSALFERGLRRLIEKGAKDKVLCQLQSSIVPRLVAKMPDELKGRLQVQEEFRYGDVAEDFECLEQDLSG
jgi:GNAT superfamily N-acetyltransferase